MDHFFNPLFNFCNPTRINRTFNAKIPYPGKPVGMKRKSRFIGEQKSLLEEVKRGKEFL
jgi:hypothetical protein